MAEPAALAGDVLESIEGITLDSIVTVVDCDALIRFPSLGHTGREQISLADIIILNKIDLIAEPDLHKARERVVSINGRALLVEAVSCELDISVLFGVGRKAPPHHHETHRIEFDYFDFVSDSRFDYDKVVAAIESLPKEIYRCKGFFGTGKGGFLVNYVAGRYTIEEFDCYRTELVFIGKGISGLRDGVIKEIERCVA